MDMDMDMDNWMAQFYGQTCYTLEINIFRVNR